MAIIMLVIPLNSFASQATNTEQAELQTLIRELNKKCPNYTAPTVTYLRDLIIKWDRNLHVVRALFNLPSPQYLPDSFLII